MKKIMFVMSVLLASACSGNKADEVLKQFEGFRDRMCKCTDEACVEKVQTEWRDWRKNTGLKKDDLSDAQKERGKKIDDEMDACRDKIRAAAKKPEAPAAPATPPTP